MTARHVCRGCCGPRGRMCPDCPRCRELRERSARTVRVSVNGLKIRQNKVDGRRRRIFRKEQGGRVTYHNKVLIPAGAKLVYEPSRPLKCGARAWIEWVER